MEQTIEQRAADTILGANLGTIEIDGIPYSIEPPTTATLVMVSGLISQLPEITEAEENESVSAWVIKHAEQAAPILGKIAAAIILGAKRIKHNPTADIKTGARKWSWRKFRFEAETRKADEADYLANRLIEELTPTELKDFILQTTNSQEVTDFFLLTTSLRTRNILTRTTETEVDKTTAYGDLS